MRLPSIAFGLLALTALPSGASAAVYVFSTDSGHITSTAGSGNGNSYTFTSATGGEHAVVTGYQFSQATGAISTAQVGVYSPGFGVIGLGDNGGANNLHQFDNAGGYTDFVQIVFDHAVTLTSLGLTSFSIGSTTVDNDLSFLALTSAFNPVSSNLTGYSTMLGAGGTPGSNGLAANVITGSAAVSRYWLVSAGVNTGTDDAFKLSSITVNSPVPEPSTWAMMLVGFGAIGVAMRRRATTAAAAFA